MAASRPTWRQFSLTWRPSNQHGGLPTNMAGDRETGQGKNEQSVIINYEI
jgi:hypothetical protein